MAINIQIMRFKYFEVLVSACSLALLAYIGWHAFYGPRGYNARDKLAVRLAEVTKQSSELSAGRQSIEARVKLMRPESIDPDLLDELARRELNVGHPTDILVKFAP
jgi:cell division protein FtsB